MAPLHAEAGENLSAPALPRWTFATRARNVKQRDPAQAEYFKADTRGISSALVRETLQNSLDAQTGAEATRVRFTVVQHDASHAATVSRYFNGLPEHLDQCGVASPPSEQLIRERSLIVEDFNTLGLMGDPVESTPSTGNHFFFFIRAEGKSGKSGGKGGRWGLGKHVYAMASSIHAYWALTRAADKETDLLIGTCILKHHDIGPQAFEPDGWWADDPTDLPLPLGDPELMAQFRSDWRMNRRAGEQGLSVVVPLIGPASADADEWSLPRLRTIVLEHFGVALLAGELVVEIAAAGPASTHVVRLDDSTVMDLVDDEHSGLTPELRARLAMITEGLTADPVALPDARSDWKNLSWEGLGEADRDSLERAAGQLEEGTVVRFRVPVDHQRKGDPRTRSHFDVLLRKREEPGSGRPSYHRSGMWILDEPGVPLGAFDAVVIALEDGISDLLGDAENPAHTRWRLASGDFTKNWVSGGRTITFVRHAPQRINSLIFRTDEVGDYTVAEEFFGIGEGAAGPKETGGAGRPTGRKVVKKPRNLPPAKPTRISVSESDDGAGFRVRAPRLPTGTELTVHVGYALSRGDGIKKWNAADFRLEEGTLSTVCEGGTVRLREGNTLVATIDEPKDFVLECFGFDPNRDLVVDVAAAGAASGDESEAEQ